MRKLHISHFSIHNYFTFLIYQSSSVVSLRSGKWQINGNCKMVIEN